MYLWKRILISCLQVILLLLVILSAFMTIGDGLELIFGSSGFSLCLERSLASIFCGIIFMVLVLVLVNLIYNYLLYYNQKRKMNLIIYIIISLVGFIIFGEYSSLFGAMLISNLQVFFIIFGVLIFTIYKVKRNAFLPEVVIKVPIIKACICTIILCCLAFISLLVWAFFAFHK